MKNTITNALKAGLAGVLVLAGTNSNSADLSLKMPHGKVEVFGGENNFWLYDERVSDVQMHYTDKYVLAVMKITDLFFDISDTFQRLHNDINRYEYEHESERKDKLILVARPLNIGLNILVTKSLAEIENKVSEINSNSVASTRFERLRQGAIRNYSVRINTPESVSVEYTSGNDRKEITVNLREELENSIPNSEVRQ